jgi:hypothetical protein
MIGTVNLDFDRWLLLRFESRRLVIKAVEADWPIHGDWLIKTWTVEICSLSFWGRSTVLSRVVWFAFFLFFFSKTDLKMDYNFVFLLLNRLLYCWVYIQWMRSHLFTVDSSFWPDFFFLSSCGMYLRYSLNNKIKDSYIILNIYHEKLYIYINIFIPS